MERRLGEVFENEDQIELLQTILDTFEGCDLDVSEGNNQEGSVGKMDETFGRGL